MTTPHHFSNYPPPDATREDIDRFFGKPPTAAPPRARCVVSVRPDSAFLAAVHHAVDEWDAMEDA